MQDQATEIREAAVASLLAYQTIAGDRVESERVDPVESGDTPRLIVMADDAAEGISRGGAAPAFRTTLTLMIHAQVEHAQRGDAVAALDTLIAQVKDALLGDPDWVRLSENIPSLRVTRSFKGDNARIIGDGRIVITCTWIEIYPPRITTPLSTVTLTTIKPAGTPPVSAEINLPPPEGSS